MADGTKIEWADATVNTLYGCTKASQGCQNCYAIGQTRRLAFLRDDQYDLLRPLFDGGTFWHSRGPYEWSGRVIVHPKAAGRMEQVVRWKKPRVIFVNSMSDTFHQDVPLDHIIDWFVTAAKAAQHRFLFLTKRPERMARLLEGHDFEGGAQTDLHQALTNAVGADGYTWPLPNVWLGFTAEDQERLDERWPHMAPLADAGWNVFVSAEPLLGSLDFSHLSGPLGSMAHTHNPLTGRHYHHDDGDQWTDDAPRLGWVIVGGESGPNARAMHPDWARKIVADCRAAGVPVMFKQWGEWAPHPRRDNAAGLDPGGPWYRSELLGEGRPDGSFWLKVGKRNAGRLLDGEEVLEQPASIQAAPR